MYIARDTCETYDISFVVIWILSVLHFSIFRCQHLDCICIDFKKYYFCYNCKYVKK